MRLCRPKLHNTHTHTHSCEHTYTEAFIKAGKQKLVPILLDTTNAKDKLISKQHIIAYFLKLLPTATTIPGTHKHFHIHFQVLRVVIRFYGSASSTKKHIKYTETTRARTAVCNLT